MIWNSFIAPQVLFAIVSRRVELEKYTISESKRRIAGKMYIFLDSVPSATVVQK